MKKINKHYISAAIFVLFVIIAFACTTVKEPSQTQGKSYSTSDKEKPVYIKRK
jgi:hypothetical protein